MKRVFRADLPVEGVSHDPGIRKQVLLRAGDAPHLTGFSRAVLLPGQSARAHRHADMYEAFFVQAGEGEITVDGVGMRLEPGVCVLVEPGEEHEIRNAGAAELVLLYFGLEA